MRPPAPPRFRRGPLERVGLLGLVLAFGFTGYLLPWDQRAYWATIVTINIAKSAPGLGDFAATVMRGGEHLGGAGGLIGAAFVAPAAGRMFPIRMFAT